ncbi:MAG: class I SAM-dependent methyltransferase [Acidobacteriota bacterium]
MRANLSHTGQRAAAWVHRLISGLPRSTRRVGDDLPTDRFQIHLAIYRFAAAHCRGLKALDLGCGTGFGTAEFARAGADEAVGIDLDPRCVAFARRHFRKTGAVFVEGDLCAKPDVLPVLRRIGAEGGADLAVAVDLLHDLEKPIPALEGASRLLRGDGRLLLAHPTDEPLAEEVDEYLRSSFDAIELWSVEAPTVDLDSTAHSVFAPDDFKILPGKSRSPEQAFQIYDCQGPVDRRSLAASM